MRRSLNLALALLLLSVSANAADCVAGVLSRLAKGASDDIDRVLKFAAGVEEGSPASRGLFAALEARKTAADGALRVRQILDNFPTVGEAVFGQLAQVTHARRLDEFVVNLAKSDTDALGASATLYFVTRRMNPADILEFEARIPGSTRIADVRDRLGNLIESKANNWDSLPEFLGDSAFGSILAQVTEFQAAAASEGKLFTLVFSNSVPAQHRAAFDRVLGAFVTLPNVRFVDGL
jgi:hypothetical protein